MTTTRHPLTVQLDYLKLGHVAEHHAALAREAAAAAWSHLEFLQRLLDGECTVRQQRAVERRVRAARFPVLKTLDQFHWDWPKKINQLQVQHLFRLGFVTQKTNVIFAGGVGLGTMPGRRLCRVACLPRSENDAAHPA